jgi:hypothetical protein
MNNKELTIEEELYYFKYALIDFCDLCGKPFPITNRNDGEDYLEYNGVQLLCNKCK